VRLARTQCENSGLKKIAFCSKFQMLSILTGCAGEVFDTPPLTPVNVSPIEGADIALSTTTTFVWLASERAQYYDFHLFNVDNGDIEQYASRNMRRDSVCENDRCRLTLSVSLPFLEGHAWRVRAGNNAGVSGWTRTRFNMINTSTSNNEDVQLGGLTTPAVPSPVSPEGNDFRSDDLVEFVWRAIPDATGYDFHIFDAVNTEMVDTLNDLPATTVCQSGELCRLTRSIALPPSAAHAWRIRAVNDKGRSDWTRSVFSVVR